LLLYRVNTSGCSHVGVWQSFVLGVEVNQDVKARRLACGR
jgi:hypothetical protein